MTTARPTATLLPVVVLLALTASVASTGRVYAQSLPPGWSAADVGAPGAPGATTYSGGVFSLSAAGIGLTGRADQFHVVYRQLVGDGVIVARLASASWGRLAASGVVIRDSLQPGSRTVTLEITGGGRLRFKQRTSSGGWLATLSETGATMPIWLRLERRGSTVVAARSADGVTWGTVGSTNVSLATSIYVGLQASSGSSTGRVGVNLSNVSVQAGTATNIPPTVSMTSPAAGASFLAPASITITASAADSDGGITRVDFYNGFTLIGSDTTSPYSMTWSNVPAGSYPLNAVARDTAGAATTSASIAISVVSNTAPAVSLISPAAGSTFLAPATIGLSASASDPDGTVARVDFFAGATLLGSDASSPFAFSWSNVAAGQYSITAVARDNSGNSTVSAASLVTVATNTLARYAVFQASSDHDALDRYVVDFWPSGADPSTANPAGSQDIGKPPVVSGECQADVGATVQALAPGQYFATVTAVGSGGSARSGPSASFTR